MFCQLLLNCLYCILSKMPISNDFLAFWQQQQCLRSRLTCGEWNFIEKQAVVRVSLYGMSSFLTDLALANQRRLVDSRGTFRVFKMEFRQECQQTAVLLELSSVLCEIGCIAKISWRKLEDKCSGKVNTKFQRGASRNKVSDGRNSCRDKVTALATKKVYGRTSDVDFTENQKIK